MRKVLGSFVLWESVGTQREYHTWVGPDKILIVVESLIDLPPNELAAINPRQHRATTTTTTTAAPLQRGPE